jgi:hypothetical protein
MRSFICDQHLFLDVLDNLWGVLSEAGETVTELMAARQNSTDNAGFCHQRRGQALSWKDFTLQRLTLR